MGQTYKQLSEEERVMIYHWHANGKSVRVERAVWMWWASVFVEV